jgi:transposase, IS605 orfB family
MSAELIKTVKQYSLPLSDEEIEILEITGKAFRNCRNYFFSRFHGIKSITKLENGRKLRDSLMNKNLENISRMPARYWKIALVQVLGNLKTLLENIKLKIRKASYNNVNLSDADRHYINSILKYENCLSSVLNFKKLDKHIYEKHNVNFRRLNNLIRRYYRRYRGKVPYSLKTNFLLLDADMYRYEKGMIAISTLKKGRRIPIKLKDERIFKGNLTLKWDTRLIIYGTAKMEIKIDANPKNVVAIDKGRRKLVTSTSGNSYGTGYSGLTRDLIEKQERKMKERQFYWNLYRKFLKSGKTLKAKNVLANNLGKKKINKFSERIREKSRSYINHELDLFFEAEKPTEIIKEDLTWENLNGKNKGKNFNRIINRWEKGYLDSQIEWKSEQRGIKITNVNPAYTSQICHICDNFGIRDGEIFTCPHCGNKMDADANAAHNIMKRKEIKEINIYTSASKVKEYYLKLNN